MLRRAGIGPEILADPKDLISRNAAAQLLDDCARESDCPHFGLLMAECAVAVEHRGAQAAAAAPGHGARRDRRHRPLSGPARRSAARRHRGQRRALDHPHGASRRDRRDPVDRALDGDGLPDDQRGRQRALAPGKRAFRPPGAKATSASTVGSSNAHLIFESEFNGFVCPTAWLDAPNPAAESVMARHAERYLDMLVPDPTDGSVTERARRSLYLLLPSGRATLEQVGDNLGLHPRALQRLLEREGRTFAILLNEVRRELALRYLSSSTHQRDRDRADDRLCLAKLVHALVRGRIRRGAGFMARRGAPGADLAGLSSLTIRAYPALLVGREPPAFERRGGGSVASGARGLADQLCPGRPVRRPRSRSRCSGARR